MKPTIRTDARSSVLDELEEIMATRREIERKFKSGERARFTDWPGDTLADMTTTETLYAMRQTVAPLRRRAALLERELA